MPSDLEDRIRRGQYEEVYRGHVQSASRDPRAMTADEIVEEITAVRQTINMAAQRVVELSRTLHQTARRHVASEHTSVYINFANAWGRFAGAVQQGIRRAQSMDRMVQRAQEAQRDEYDFPRAPPPPARQSRQSGENTAPATAPHRSNPFAGNPLDGGQSMNDLMELYGQEIVRDAVRR
jgi:hypothetical protein